MKKILIATMMLGVSSAAAFAADMSAPAAYDWTGLYAGLNGGYAFSGDDNVAIAPGGAMGDLSIHGIFGGAQLGYNQQMNNIVLGVETDIQGGSIRDTDSFGGVDVAKDRLNWFGTLRGRAGFAADRALIYATGGLAYGGGKYQELVTPATKNYSRLGWTVGAGVEYAVSDSFTVKAEYLYANFGRFTVGGTQATPDFHSVRLGVNFRF